MNADLTILFVTVRCENGLADPLGEVDRRSLGTILRRVADQLEEGSDGRPILDLDGNRVGDWALTERKPR